MTDLLSDLVDRTNVAGKILLYAKTQDLGVAIFSEGFNFQGVHCYRSKDDSLDFYFIPGEPTLERDPSGRPALILLASDLGTILESDRRGKLRAQRLPDFV